MGRRRKRDQDFDGSLEADYVRQRRREVQGEKDDDDEAADNNDTTAAVDQVERNRRKKARRKERQKEKAQERKEATAAAADQAKSARDEKSAAPAVKTERPASSIAWSSMARGVQYHDMVIGQGPIVQDRQTVRVKYKLRADNVHKGKVIDSSQNFGFRLGKGEVIQGWDIGMVGMKVGGRRLLVIPPKAGYGVGRDVGAGKGGILYFDVTVLR
jgi:FKBP-type peptidyl-prolyl cis-trans isomerase